MDQQQIKELIQEKNIAKKSFFQNDKDTQMSNKLMDPTTSLKA